MKEIATGTHDFKEIIENLELVKNEEKLEESEDDL